MALLFMVSPYIALMDVHDTDDATNTDLPPYVWPRTFLDEPKTTFDFLLSPWISNTLIHLFFEKHWS